jgi:hypothetical protein
MVKVNKLLLTVIFSIILISLVSASVATYKLGEDVNLVQTCASCSAITITSVLSPNGTLLLNNVVMTKTGDHYNYTLSSNLATEEGTYKVSGIGDPNSIDTVWSYDFDMNNRGIESDAFWILRIIIWLLLYPLIFFIFIIRTKVPLFNFIGYFFILINSIIGITLLDSTLGYITLGGSVILVVEKLYRFLQTEWRD